MKSRLLRVSGGLGLLCFAWTAACSRPAAKFNLSQPHIADQLIIKLKATTGPSALKQIAAEQGVQIADLGHQAYLLSFPAGSDLAERAEALSRNKQIQNVEANLIYHLEERTPNDPRFDLTYGLKNSGQKGGLVGADIAATRAWVDAVGDRKVVVGIIDSGIDYRHEDLAANIWLNPGESGLDESGQEKAKNGIDDDGNGFVDDWRGWDFFNEDNDPLDDNSHGTHVAGTVGAVGDNGVGIAGVNWQVSMVPLKIFSGAGETSTDRIVRAIDYATSIGVDVSNNSWGGGAYSEVIFSAIQRAEEKDILFVAAAGNEATDTDREPHFPSSYQLKNIISVASTNRFDRLSFFSNYGETSVHVAAPGEEIYSTIPNNGYDYKSGTSMATPHVTGLVALLLSRYPELRGEQLRNKILLSSTPKAELLKRVVYGRIDASSALENDAIPPAAVQDIQIASLGIRDLTLSVEASGDDDRVGRAARYQVRMSAAPIESEDDWKAASALRTVQTDSPDGRVLLSVSGLDVNTSGYLSLRAEDNVGNISALGGSIVFSLPEATILWENDNDSIAGWPQIDAPWTIVSEGDLSYLADSAGRDYDANINIKAVSSRLTFASSQLELSLRSKWDIESGYDFGYIEISVDEGQNWKTVDTLTGTSQGWETRLVPLAPVLEGQTSFLLRLRLETDFSVNYDGWDVDSLQIIGQQSQ